MKLLVYDIPAITGGALTVLKEVYAYAVDRVDINWIFVINAKVVSLEIFHSKPNIRIVVAEGAERSWFARMQYDVTKLKKLVFEEKPDAVISLANVMIPICKVRQFVYMHNLIPFCNLKFSFFKQRKLWIYQHIIAKIIYLSMHKCNKVIVQTKWVQDAVMEKCNLPKDKFILCPPQIGEDTFFTYQDTDEARRTFFYPAGMSEFKNHVTVVRAVRELVGKGEDRFRIIFTCKPEIQEIDGESLKGLPITMTGYMHYDDVLKQYANSVMVFPSRLETFGLPLLEARRTGSIIIAGNTPFAHEILNGYENALFFDEMDSKALMNCMWKVMSGEFQYEQSPSPIAMHGGWNDVIEQLIAEV